MTGLLVRSNATARGTQPLIRITPESAGWNYIGFEVYRLAAGDVVTLDSTGVELTAIVLEGTCDISVGPREFTAIGHRASVFDDAAPEAVYAPPGNSVKVTACSPSEVAVATSKAIAGAGAARVIRSSDIAYERRGSGGTERFIHHILDEHHPAEKLLLVEVVTPAGNWSSFPPHKHDEDTPDRETYLEETYYYRFHPQHGQALQRVYDKQDMDAVLAPRDGDVVLVPRGYHPVSAIPGFQCYYLNVMAGNHRVWRYQVDSDYSHITPKDGNIVGKIEMR